MPTYIYRIVNENGTLGEKIELNHASGEILKQHPTSGQKIQKIPGGFNMGGGSSKKMGSEPQYGATPVANFIEVNTLIVDQQGNVAGVEGEGYTIWKKGPRISDGPSDMSVN